VRRLGAGNGCDLVAVLMMSVVYVAGGKEREIASFEFFKVSGFGMTSVSTSFPKRDRLNAPSGGKYGIPSGCVSWTEELA